MAKMEDLLKNMSPFEQSAVKGLAIYIKKGMNQLLIESELAVQPVREQEPEPQPKPEPAVAPEEPAAGPSNYIFKIPSRTMSGRTIKRTSRFISQSDDEEDQENDAEKSPKPGKKSTKKSSEDVTHPAKKRKIMEPKRQKIDTRSLYTLFGVDASNLIQSERERHSRLSEVVYERDHCTHYSNHVEFQYRASENLAKLKSTLPDQGQRLKHLKGSPMAMKLMEKFASLKNRNEISNEFKSKFATTKCTQWKPFAEDPQRLAEIQKYQHEQRTKLDVINENANELLADDVKPGNIPDILKGIFFSLEMRIEQRQDLYDGLVNMSFDRDIAKKKDRNVVHEPVDVSKIVPFHL